METAENNDISKDKTMDRYKIFSVAVRFHDKSRIYEWKSPLHKIGYWHRRYNIFCDLFTGEINII